MQKEQLFSIVWLPHKAQKLFLYLCSSTALQRLLPPYLCLDVSLGSSVQEVGGKVVLILRWGPFTFRSVYVHLLFDPRRYLFIDQQLHGPFRYWRHEHWVREKNNGTEVVDTIDFIKPFYMPNAFLIKNLHRLWRFREKRMSHDLAMLQRYPGVSKRILITGASGLIGRELSDFLKAGYHDVVHFKRVTAKEDLSVLSKEQIENNPFLLEHFDVIIHLAGENIARRRWSKRQKALIETSRIEILEFFKTALQKCRTKPRLFLSASAVGIYGSCQDRMIDEGCEAGCDFLSKVCSSSEHLAYTLEDLGMKVVIARLGYVLSPKGGLLKKILPLFRWGLGARLGSGKRLFPWVAIDDVIYALYHLIMIPSASGPYNISAPTPLPQKEFAKKLANVLQRPLVAAAPACLINAVLGEMGQALLMSSIGALPKRLLISGYTFAYPSLEDYLADSLK